MNRWIVLFVLAAAGLFSKDCFVDVKDGKLFCHELGEGTPVIVLHGGPGLSQDYLLPGMEKLAEHHRVVFYDQRGAGRSENSGKISLDVYVEDLEAVRREFGFEKMAVVGHSWGGLVAMRYAAAHPDAVDKMVLLNSMMASSEDFALFAQAWHRALSPYIDEMEQIKKSEAYLAGDPDTVERFFKTLFAPYFAFREQVHFVNFRGSVEANLKWIATYDFFSKTLLSHPFDYFEDLKNLRCKTLIVHGDVDIIPSALSEHLHRAIAHSKFAILRECGHFPYVEQPDELFTILNEFLQ